MATWLQVWPFKVQCFDLRVVFWFPNIFDPSVQIDNDKAHWLIWLSDVILTVFVSYWLQLARGVGSMRLTFAWFNILSFSNSECTFYDETPIGKSTVRCVLMQCTHSHTTNATCIFIFSTSIDWVSSLCFRVFIYSTLRSSLCSMLRSSIIHLVRMAQTISKAMAGQSRQMHFLKKQRTDNSVHTNAGIH